MNIFFGGRLQRRKWGRNHVRPRELSYGGSMRGLAENQVCRVTHSMAMATYTQSQILMLIPVHQWPRSLSRSPLLKTPSRRSMSTGAPVHRDLLHDLPSTPPPPPPSPLHSLGRSTHDASVSLPHTTRETEETRATAGWRYEARVGEYGLTFTAMYPGDSADTCRIPPTKSRSSSSSRPPCCHRLNCHVASA